MMDTLIPINVINTTLIIRGSQVTIFILPIQHPWLVIFHAIRVDNGAGVDLSLIG
jgi:hypothetical protein